MSSNFASNDVSELQRALHTSSGDFDTQHGRAIHAAEESEDSSQTRNAHSSRSAHTSGGIPIEFVPAGRSDSGLSCTTPNVLDDTHLKVNRFGSIGSTIIYLWTPPLPEFTENHPLVFIFVRTLQAVVWAFGFVGFLKVTILNGLVIPGCLAAAIFVGAVFVSNLAAYLRLQYPGSWRLTFPLLGHFLSFEIYRLDLGDALEAHGPAGQEIRVLQEILLDSMSDGIFKALVALLTYPFSGFRDLYSLPIILMTSISALVYLGGATALVAMTRSPPQLSYQSFLLAEVIAGALFLQLLSAYLRPNFPTLKIYVTWFIHSVTFVLTILLVPSAIFGVSFD